MAVLDVVVPVHNEEADLGPCVRRLHAHLTAHFPYPFRITVADNASVDGTLAVAEALAGELPEVEVLHLDAKGRGRALRAAWSASDAAGAGVHGRGPVHRPGRAAAAGRAAHLRPLRPGHRHPAGRGPPGWSGAPSGR